VAELVSLEALRECHLTPPSSGRAPASRVTPLMSNVSPLPGIPMRRVTTVRTTSRAASHWWLSRAARIAHGGSVPDRMAAETQLALARAVRPLAAGAPPVLLAQGSGALSTAVLSNHRCRMQPEGEHTNSNQMPWLTRRARTLALRRSAEPEPQGSAGAGFARAASAVALAWQSQGRSVVREGPYLRSPGLTPPSSGQPSAAAHVER